MGWTYIPFRDNVIYFYFMLFIVAVYGGVDAMYAAASHIAPDYLKTHFPFDFSRLGRESNIVSEV
jgi:hypothetical protein